MNMKKVNEIRGMLFSTTLKDGTNLCLQPTEEVTIKDNLIRESLIEADRQGFVNISDVVVETKATSEKKIGGADK